MMTLFPKKNAVCNTCTLKLVSIVYSRCINNIQVCQTTCDLA